MEKQISILIADDHPVFRRGLRQVVESDGRFRIAHEVENGEQALAALEQGPCDIAVLDVDMPGLTGIDVVRTIQKRRIPVEVIFITMYKEEYMFNKAMDLGVRGYVLKESAVADILNGIRAVAERKYYISPSISEYLVRRSGRQTALPAWQGGVADLTPMERRIMRLIAENKTSREIAAELDISPKTVDRHRENVANKLNLHGPHALLKFALENKNHF